MFLGQYALLHRILQLIRKAPASREGCVSERDLRQAFCNFSKNGS